MAHFYCLNLVGDPDFSIKEYNEQRELCRQLGIHFPCSNPPACKEQCFRCMAIVGERRKQTQSLLNNNNHGQESSKELPQ